MKRLRITVKGTVQGVGFRPTIYRYAVQRDLSGHVLNTSDGVIIEVEGEKVHDFLKELKSNPPPASEIDEIKVEEIGPKGDGGFKILKSVKTGVEVPIPPDMSVCDKCIRELLDKSDRRYFYPFINCTNCGPRFTIIAGVPYDRPKTTMKKFLMCNLCKTEYEDPLNRRFHAQPNACGVCGPKIWLLSREGNLDGPPREIIRRTNALLRAGKILAIKGLGGFHLACDAFSPQAVAELRRRKGRAEKPFAVMAKDIGVIKRYCHVSPEEEKILGSYKRPIVLLRKKGNGIAEEVSPNNKYLGFMLPYAPIHYLLFFHDYPSPEVLVMTSGNLSEEPICFENEEAVARLGNIADYFLLHDRDIFMRCDDSVTRMFEGKERVIRRARGYVPIPIKMNFNFKRPIFGCGADLKNTFCMVKGNRAILSHHIGDMENLETLNSYEQGIRHFEKFLEFRPEIIAHDMHPEYYSTKYALEREEEKIQVQHHHAHVVSCMAENDLTGKVIGVAFDGTGYGADGKIWGGEFLVCDREHFERKAHLEYIPLPGGEKAIKQPWRMSFSYLYEIYGEEFLNRDFGFLSLLNDKKIEILKNMLDKGINSPPTSSMGRLFDAVSCIVNPKYEITYEGQAAAEFEQISSDEGDYSAYDYEVKKENKIFSINVKSIIVGVVEDLGKISAGEISRRFHLTVANLVKDVCLRIAEEEDIRNVALSGGVFQNFTLLEILHELLPSSGLNLYLHGKVPPNDGGISLGQVVIANSKCG